MIHRSELASRIPPAGNAIELGVARGFFSAQLLSSPGAFTLYSVDRWAGDRGHGDSQCLEAYKRLSPFGSRSVVIRLSFDVANGLFEDQFFDLVYVDGYAHTGQDDGRTLQEWWPKVKDGGIFSGHDYHPKFQETMRAVDEFASSVGREIHLTTGDRYPTWWIQK